MATVAEIKQDSGFWDGMGELFTNVAGSALGVLIENERETPAGDAVSASPVVHQQIPRSTQPTGTVNGGQSYTFFDWARSNWQLVLLAVALAVLLILYLVK